MENKRNKKILIVMPKFPYPAKGACEQDRFEGIRILKNLGYDLSIISKIHPKQMETVKKVSDELGIKITPVLYKNNRSIKRIFNPLFWDGAAYEYRDKDIVDAFNNQLNKFCPGIIWFEYSNLWPLYKYARKKKIPIITRSHNFEATHFLEEEGWRGLNLLRFISKFLGEIIVSKKSDMLFAITPKEAESYKKIGARKVLILPLRSLGKYLDDSHTFRDNDTINIFFMGSTYNVVHNRKALEFIIKEIAPAIEKQMPGKFVFHITGAKMPDDMLRFFGDRIIYHGYVDNMDEFVKNMDIALVPSLFGAGMQQKIFEPLCRGIPTITSKRGLANYPFENEKHLLLAENLKEYIKTVIRMRDIDLRRNLSKNSIELCCELFSKEKIKSIISKGINEINLTNE